MTSIATGRRVAFGALLAAWISATGCNNALEWTNDPNSFEGLMAAGKQAMRDEHYAYAEGRFAAAVELRPQSADARFYVSKAAVLSADVDVFTLVQILTDEDRGAVDVFAFQTEIANSIYGVNRTVIDNLRPIENGLATEGDFAAANVDLDLAIGYTLRGILRLRDTNGDGVIDGNDLSPDDFGLTDDGEFSLDGIDEMAPEDLNALIGDVNGLLTEGGDLLEDVLGDSGIDTEDLDELVTNLGGDLSAFYVNTGVPGNPGEGDNDGDGFTDEECLNGIDDDGDGITDEDTRVFTCP
jgi:hypothetical protein